MKISDSRHQQLVVVAFEGRFDTWDLLEVGPQIRDLISSAQDFVAFELSQVSAIDAGGMSLILECQRQLRDRGLDLILVGAKGGTADSLQAAQVGDRINITTNVDLAVSMVASTIAIDPSSLLSEMDGEEL